jgi:hypothetical protein
MLKVFKIFALLLLAVVVVALSYVVITFPPVMAGMAAKTMCSCVFVTGRTPESVRKKELQVFPGLPDANIALNYDDSTATAKILWRTSKAIFRKGLGCTLLASRSEGQVRAQPINLPAPPRLDPDTVSWPSGDLLSDTVFAGVDYDRIHSALDKAFIPRDPARPIFTHAVIAVYRGQIVAEKYAPGFDLHSKLMGWSMAKSITNALTGVLVKAGKLSVDGAAPVPEWQHDDRRNITLNHLLQASSGLAWSESYFNPTSNFHDMFIRSDDKGEYALSRKLKHKPGEFFEYSSGTTNILSRIIRHTVGDKLYYRFPYEALCYKIGMRSTLLEPDASGTFVGSSYCFATARDWARFGLLYLKGGIWNGEQVLPEGWVEYTTTPASSAAGKYGAQWWLNRGRKAAYPTLPPDAFWADGFEEQYVMVIPSSDLVIVRLGVSHVGSGFEDLVQEVIRAVR